MSDRPKTSEPKPTRLTEKLIDLAAVALLVPVLLPLVVVFTPTLYLESDPRLLGDLQSVVISFGPAGSMWLAAAAIVIAAAALGLTALAGGKVRWWSCALVAAGIVPCLLHMPEHFNSRLHGGAWIAAALLGLAAAHLAQFGRAKRFIVAAVIAMALPFFLQSAWYVYVDHPATLQSFHDNLDRDLAMRGLTRDTPEYVKYLTRLEGNDAIGAVGMSNVFGSIVAAITVLGLVVSVIGLHKRRNLARLAGVISVLLLGLWTLKLTQSRGALLALCLTVGLGVSLFVFKKFVSKPRGLVPVLCLLFVLLGSGAVLVRGVMGPPKDYHGERSLLFRYHYWQGATQLLVDEPSLAITGVGPGQFKDRYESVRNPISPEVVSSTHNVFVDQAVMLGLGGVAWGGLLLMWLWQAGAAAGRCLTVEADSLDPDETEKPPVKMFILLGALVFGTQYYVQLPALYAETAILWLIGLLGFVSLSAFVVYPVLARSRTWVTIGLTLAAAMLLLHAQIEMTFFWDSAAAFVWVVVGLASFAGNEPQRGQPAKHSMLRFVPAVILLIFGVVFAVAFADPTARQQELLWRTSEALRFTNPAAAMRELDAAAQIIPNDPTATHWRVRLRQEIATALAMNGRHDDAESLLKEAAAVLDEADAAGLSGVSTERKRAGLAMAAYQITGERDWLNMAEQMYAHACELSPNSLNDHIRLGDARWQLGDFDGATEAYRRALQINQNYYLDPGTQLNDEERGRIERRIGGE
ncbi:MAG: O-antigen ligase family protein [Phycisphaerales bacterium]